MKHVERLWHFGFFLVGAFALLATAPAIAADQPLTPTMTCASVQNAVKTLGALVLWTGPHLYDRYVDNASFCPTMMRTEAAWVPTRDNPQCFIGYTCEQTNTRWRR